MCVRPKYFLFAAVPVVSGCRPPSGRGPVRRDQQEPGRGETLRRMRGRVHAEVQPGQILPGLCGADAPEERGRTAAAKIPVFGRTEMNTQKKSHADKNMSTICAGLVNERPTNPTNNSV